MNKIRELRLKMGWRQEDLAQRMHTKRQTIARYETEQLGIDADTICRLCDIFNVTADYLLCRSDVPTPALSPDEAAMLAAYNRAPPEIRRIVDYTLHPYQKNTAATTA